jgi:hypothetical protein
VAEACPEVGPFLLPQKDHCYCLTCHPPSKGSRENGYIIPRGWVGLAVAMPAQTCFEWDTTFHGTLPERVGDILHHRRIGMPGDVLPNGALLQGSNSAGRNDKVFYTSPTVNYASLQTYATSSLYGEHRAGQVVLQCKQDPSTVKQRQAETMGFAQAGAQPHDVCQFTSLFQAGIEICSDRPEGCVPQRVLVRTFALRAPGYTEALIDGAQFAGKTTLEAPYDLRGRCRPGTKRGERGVWLREGKQ